MGVDGACNVLHGGGRLHGKDRLASQFGHVTPHGLDADDRALFVGHHGHSALGLAQCAGSTRGAQRELEGRGFPAGLGGLVQRQSDRQYLGVAEHHHGDRRGIECRGPSAGGVDGHLSFGGGLVGERRAGGQVADCVHPVSSPSGGVHPYVARWLHDCTRPGEGHRVGIRASSDDNPDPIGRQRYRSTVGVTILHKEAVFVSANCSAAGTKADTEASEAPLH